MQYILAVAGIIVIFLSAFAQDKKWFHNNNNRKAVVLALLGVMTIGLWRASALFAGFYQPGGVGLVISGILILAAFLNRDKEERSYRLPFLASAGLTNLFFVITQM